MKNLTRFKLTGTVVALGLLIGCEPDFLGAHAELIVGAPGEAPGASPRSGVAFMFRGAPNGVEPAQVIDQAGLGANEQGDEFGSSFATGDFDGDGLTDLAIGAPGEAPGPSPRSGAVFIFLGNGDGLTPDVVLDQAGLGSNEAGDRFGASLVSGDFNDDGYEDLVVGAPGEAPGPDPKSGVVFLFLGSANGLVPHVFIDQAGLGGNEADDRFGESLSVGDYNNDGHDDLAVGAPGEAPGSDPKSGVVFTFRGNSSGLSPHRVLDQKGLGANELNDLFGTSLASGDFNNDGRDDLAVGAPGEAPGSDPRSGVVFVFRGRPQGLVAAQLIDQAGLGGNEAGDDFGRSLSSGDYNGDGRSDLAVGAPGEAPGADPKSGVVFVFRGTSTTLVADQLLTQQGLGSNEAGDRFGASLSSANYVGDFRDDLAVGAPGEAPGPDPQSGGVFLFRGGPTQLTALQFVDQAGLGANEAGDLFGAALAE